MSMILTGVDMPECCGGCPCCHERYDGSSFCAAIEDGPCDIDNIDGYLPNCPAKPKKYLAVPHGRLIDAGALMEVIELNAYTLKGYYNSTDKGMFISGIKQAIDEAPTIIEAED